MLKQKEIKTMNNTETLLKIQDIIMDSNLIALDNNTIIKVSKRIAELSVSYTSESLRNEFESETGIAPVFANRVPYINYIEFLENKITK